MESTRHYWFRLRGFLNENAIPVLLNLHHVKKSKELNDNSHSQSERKAPKVITGLVKDGRFTEPYIQEGVYAKLRWFEELMRLIEKLMEKILEAKNF